MPAPVGSRGDMEAPWLLALHFHDLIYERPLVPSNMLDGLPTCLTWLRKYQARVRAGFLWKNARYQYS